MAAGRFHKIKCSAILLQAATRRYQAMKLLIEYKKATTNIAACWRRHHRGTFYKKTISGKKAAMLA